MDFADFELDSLPGLASSSNGAHSALESAALMMDPSLQSPISAPGFEPIADKTSSSFVTDTEHLPIFNVGKNTASLADQQAIIVSDIGAIRDRWMYSLVLQSKRICDIGPAGLDFLSKVLNSYARKIAHNGRKDPPPFVHRSQFCGPTPSRALVNFTSITRLWLEDREDGAKELVEDTMKREMMRLLDEVCISLIYLTLDILLLSRGLWHNSCPSEVLSNVLD